MRQKNCVEINDELKGTYDEVNQIRFKTSMLRSSLCNYSNAYILVKGSVTVRNTADAGAATNNADKNVIFKNLNQFINWISRIINTLKVFQYH